MSLLKKMVEGSLTAEKNHESWVSWIMNGMFYLLMDKSQDLPPFENFARIHGLADFL